MAQYQQQEKPELQECTECGQMYDIVTSNTYGPQCESCSDSKPTTECHVCEEQAVPRKIYFTSDPLPYDARGKVPVCDDCIGTPGATWTPSRGI